MANKWFSGWGTHKLSEEEVKIEHNRLQEENRRKRSIKAKSAPIDVSGAREVVVPPARQKKATGEVTVPAAVKTKGGSYPVYSKKSAEGKSFGQAFAAARKKGLKIFTWQGRKYITKVK